MKFNYLTLPAILLFTFNYCVADNASIMQTKNKLKQIDGQINQLKQTLLHVNDKRGVLNQELASTEKQIGDGILKLHTIQQDISSNQQKIISLQQRMSNLDKQLTTQQQILAQHLRSRYKIGEYQPLKWILNQDDPHAISRLLTFHQYLIRSRQNIINEIASTKKNWLQNQEALKNKLSEQQKLKQQVHIHQQELEHNKHYHTEVIRTINQDIQSKQHKLTEYQRNKDNLSQLLKMLAMQSISHPSQPFNHMHHKLPKPVKVAGNAMQKMNQGVTFFASEGTPVNAVYPGKVVFSDWLNGYGLLMILDHGQGFMTLYAHNQSLFKKKGVTVQQGEQIAAVGHSGGIKQNGLYFEVRQRGKAVPPLEWLS